MSRRTFPHNSVDAFLITARHLNLTHAAKELCLTQVPSAVKSRRWNPGSALRCLSGMLAGCDFPPGQRPAS